MKITRLGAFPLIPFITLLIFAILSVPSAQVQAQAETDATTSSLQVLDIAERPYDGGNAIAVTFNQALDATQNIDRYLNISTKNGESIDGAWILSENFRLAYFTHTQPQTEYVINVYPGLMSQSRVRLNRSKATTLKTRKIDPGVRFVGNDVFMPMALSDGLSVEATNVDEVNIDFFRVSDSKVSGFVGFMRRYGNSNWYAYRLKQMTEYASLVYSGRFDLHSTANKRRIHNIAVAAIDELKQPGIYAAVMSRPGMYNESYKVAYFSRTDIGLHTRIYPDQIDVYVSSIATGKPLEKITVSLMDEDGEVLISLRSNVDGLVSFPAADERAKVITALSDQQFSFLNLQGPALDLSQFSIGERTQRSEEIFVYAPRDLYRPGETVEFSALRRDQDGNTLDPIPLSVKILRPDRGVADSFTWHPETGGYYNHEYRLADTAKTGNWKIQITGVDQNPVEYAIKVEDFLPERMQIEFNHGSRDPLVVSGRQPINLPVYGSYLYGAPASGNRVNAVVQLKKAMDWNESVSGYQFGDIADAAQLRVTASDVVLDEQGKGVIQLPPAWRDTQAALEVKLFTSLYESGGRPVTRAYSAYVWPQPQMIGIRAEFAENNPPGNSRPQFEIIKSNFSGESFAAKNLQARLIREDRNYFWEFTQHRGWEWNWSESEYPVYSQSFDLSAEQPAKISVPVEYGHYRLEVYDEDNPQQLTSVRFHAGEDWYARWRENNKVSAAAKPDQVTLALNAKAYRPGDTARLRVVSPHAGQAIITVESDQLLWFQRTRIEAGGSTIEIPVANDWDRHDIYISAVVFKPGDSKDSISPNRAIGLIHLPLDRSDRQLKIAIDVADKLKPNRTHEIQLQVDGARPSAERYLTLAAVDVGALAISDFKTPDPVAAFFGQRRYSIDQRDLYNRIMEVTRSQPATLRFGGDAMLAKGGEMARADVQIVSLFSGLVKLGEQGKASVPLQIPDFNGRLRLMALAFDDDSFGSADKEITVASPLVAELSMPRFLAFNDEAQLALDVTNLSGRQQNLTLKLTTEGPLHLLAPVERSLDLQDGERTILRFQVTAGQSQGNASIHAQISGINSETIEKSWKLAVRSAYPSVTRSVSKLLSAGESLNLSDEFDLSGYRAETLQALVSLSSQANLRLGDQLDKLIGYPYGCLEQTTSKAYPLAFSTVANLDKMGISEFTRAQIQERIDKGIKRLSSLQKTNGGFGLWNSHSNEEQWLTAYVADFLLVARNNGFDISGEMLETTLNRLQSYVRRSQVFMDQRYSESPQHYAFAAKAYAAYLLAQLQKVPLGSLRSLYDREAENAKSPLPLLHLGLALRLQGDNKRATEAFAKALDFPKSEKRSYLGDYGSRIRDLGMTIHLLIKHAVETSRARELAFQLADEIADKHYLSTQERSALFLAGLSLKSLQQAYWSADIQLDDRHEAMNAHTVGSRLFKSTELARQFIIKAQQGDVYSSVTVSGYLKQAPQPESAGMSISKHYFTLDGEEADLQSLRSGDLLLVDLTVSAEKRSPDALIVDLLPAGFELENQNLNHSVNLQGMHIDAKSIEEWTRELNLKHQEFRDDRYLAAVDLNGYSNSHVIYLVRAVTPGHYAVPAAFVEDMYRPDYRAVAETVGHIRIEAAE